MVILGGQPFKKKQILFRNCKFVMTWYRYYNKR